MHPRERILTALKHKEPDHVPIDIGGTDVTGINARAYSALLPLLGFDIPEEISIFDTVQQLADIDEKVLCKLSAHCRSIYPNSPTNWQLEISEDKDSEWFIDEWGITWRKPKDGGIYFDLAKHPLAEISAIQLSNYPWPNPTDSARRDRLLKSVRDLCEDGEYAVVLSGITGGGSMEVSAWLSGFENFFITLASEPKTADALLDKVLEIKLSYWQSVLPEIGEYVDIISESEDLGMQDRLLISPQMFRQHIKPRIQLLISGIKETAPHVKVMLHSDGAIFEIIPDLIEIGVDILNPVQVSAKGMGDTALLKREFGQSIVFWGGIDTQNVLPFQSPKKVKDEVRRRIDDLAPGGGYVMATVHNIQYNTPPENVLAMWEAWSQYGKY